MQPTDILRLTWVATLIVPSGRTVAVVVWHVDADANDYRSAIWLVALDGLVRRAGSPRARSRILPRAGRPTGRGSPSSRTGTGSEAALRHLVRGWGGGTSYRPRGGRRRGCLVAGRTAPRLLGPCPGPGVRGRGREAAATASIHGAPIQARQHGWTGDRRTATSGTVAADGSAPPTQLTDGDYEDQNPAWSPEGRASRSPQHVTRTGTSSSCATCFSSTRGGASRTG